MKSFETLLKQIATEPNLRTSDLYVLSKMDREALRIFEGYWPTVPAQRRRDIMQELVEISEANFEVYFDPVFLLGLADEDPHVRASSINGLWEYENPALIEPLVHLLKSDPAEIVRAAAATSLGKFIYLGELEKIDQYRTDLAREALLETIRRSEEELEVRRRAIESVAYSGEAEVLSIIESAYYDENEKMQVSAIFAMGRSADPHWQPQVIAELDNPHNEIRFEAARACGELEATAAVPKLVELLEEDEDMEVQEMVIWALGRIGGPVAREVLELVVESDVETLAVAAEEALDELRFLNDSSFLLYDFEDDDFDDLPLDELDEAEDADDVFSRN